MDNIVTLLILLVILIVPVVLIGLDIMFFAKKKENLIFELLAFFIGAVYIVLGYTLWGLPDYKTPLNIYDTANMHEPFASAYAISIFLFALCGFVCYIILKYCRKKLPPLCEALLLGGVYLGCILSAVWLVQLLCGSDSVGMRADAYDYGIRMCLCIVPVIYLVHVVELLTQLVRERAQKQESLHYENQTLQRLNLWFIKGSNLFLMAFLAMLPLLGILMIILCLFGQQPDSIILAFTKTSDWLLSTEIAPPPVEFDTHYLCTVSLRGHRRLVKPIRYGIRHGKRIVVNRQLCVANAFEQLLMERTPDFHHALRHFYDTYGYPISKHINKAWTADVVYLIMKPLEWLFVIILYLFDEKPENRICSQYLGTQSPTA